MTKRGFTLVEALTVVAVIGTLMTLTAYAITQAQRQARDAKRKSDLTAISVAFQSRYHLRTCDSEIDVNRYPGWRSFNVLSQTWPTVDSLAIYSDSCGAFSEFLPSIPTDPFYNSKGDPGYIYYLSGYTATPKSVPQGKHFRLGAKLERQPNQSEICRLSEVWVNQFRGKPYPGCLDPDTQNYFIGE